MLSDDEKLELARGCEGHVEFADRIIAAHTAKLLAGVELPEEFTVFTEDEPNSVIHGYTKDQLQQYAAAAAAQARMKALNEAKEVVRDILRDEHSDLNYKGASEVQAAIEKLKGGER